VRPRAKVTIDKWQYRSRIIDWYQNEWPWPLLRGCLRSRQPLRHIHRWISRRPVQIKAWFQRTTNRKWPMASRMVTYGTDDVTWPGKVNGVTPICLGPIISKTVGDLVWNTSGNGGGGPPLGAFEPVKTFPWSRHVTAINKMRSLSVFSGLTFNRKFPLLVSLVRCRGVQKFTWLY